MVLKGVSLDVLIADLDDRSGQSRPVFCERVLEHSIKDSRNVMSQL